MFWKGPTEDGITYSLLCRFLECRERFRILMVEGLREKEDFNHKIEYGTLWHACEEAGSVYLAKRNILLPAAREHLDAAKEDLLNRFPEKQEQIDYWAAICWAQYQVYVEHYRRYNSGVRVMSEKAFRVKYKLPSGRHVVLRGKWDGVNRKLTAEIRKHFHVLQENKTKGDIDEEGTTATIRENLQAMLYLIAIQTAMAHFSKQVPPELHGQQCSRVLYNVIRRPLSDRFAIRRKKTESVKQFIDRLQKGVKEKPDHFFYRWDIRITPAQTQAFRRQVFDPILENLLDWWEYIQSVPDPFRAKAPNPIHWRYPWGAYHQLATGFRGSFFSYLTKGDRSGLTKAKTLFPELQE